MLSSITEIEEKFITDIKKKELYELEQLLEQLSHASTYIRNAIALKKLFGSDAKIGKFSCVDILNNNKED